MTIPNIHLFCKVPISILIGEKRCFRSCFYPILSGLRDQLFMHLNFLFLPQVESRSDPEAVRRIYGNERAVELMYRLLVRNDELL